MNTLDEAGFPLLSINLDYLLTICHPDYKNKTIFHAFRNPEKSKCFITFHVFFAFLFFCLNSRYCSLGNPSCHPISESSLIPQSVAGQEVVRGKALESECLDSLTSSKLSHLLILCMQAAYAASVCLFPHR